MHRGGITYGCLRVTIFAKFYVVIQPFLADAHALCRLRSGPPDILILFIFIVVFIIVCILLLLINIISNILLINVNTIHPDNIRRYLPQYFPHFISHRRTKPSPWHQL